MQVKYDSNGIGVFPASLRIYNGMGKYTTENNLTGITRSVTDFDSFLISRTKADNPFKFVIHGYYFEIANDTSGLQTAVNNLNFAGLGPNDDDKNYYAHILVENANEYSRLVNFNRGIDPDEKQYLELDSELDNKSVFTALKIDKVANPSIDAGRSYTVYTLKITGEDGDLYPPSFNKIDVQSIGSDNGENVGAFEVDSTGSLGFSQPIWFNSETGWDTVNTIFWGENPPQDSVTINGVTQPLNIGDIFFSLAHND